MREISTGKCLPPHCFHMEQFILASKAILKERVYFIFKTYLYSMWIQILIISRWKKDFSRWISQSVIMAVSISMHLSMHWEMSWEWASHEFWPQRQTSGKSLSFPFSVTTCFRVVSISTVRQGRVGIILFPLFFSRHEPSVQGKIKLPYNRVTSSNGTRFTFHNLGF